MSRTKVMAPKPRCTQHFKNCRKSMSLPLTAYFARENCHELSIKSYFFACFAISFEPEMLESLSNPLKTRIVA